MKKNFSACVYTATAKAAKVINIEVNVFLNAEGAPVPGVYFAALNPGEITVFIEFNGVLFLFRTYQEETFYFRENELGAFLGAIASDVPGSIRARRLWPSFCVLLAIQKAYANVKPRKPNANGPNVEPGNAKAGRKPPGWSVK